MIKVILHLAKIIIAATAALLFASCTAINGSGNVTTENRKVEGTFTKVSVSGGLEAYISQGNVGEITVETDDNLQQYIKTEVSGGELKIYTDKSISPSKATNIRITLPVIEAVSSAGGSTVKGKTVFKSNAILLESSSGSNLEVNVSAVKIDAESSSGSTLNVTGTADELIAESSSGSTLNAGGLTAKNVDADASSGSTINTKPVEKLTAEASSGSHVGYIKTPSSLKTDVSSGGSVSQE
ncbi:head GIN domain-containing protein [Flavobacterium sp. RHBU_24]|uniref:head GIN domain-containing protein n=1 Tax=Flavobacterium sp. RHBU_24 TaxID=3391185 RepID=UPI003984A576